MEWFDRVLAKRDDAIPSFMNVDAINSYVDKFMQLDQPEMTGTETAADIALGFAPYVGTAMGYRDFERARRADDKLGMGLGILSMLPVVGGAVKAGRKGVNRIIDELDMSHPARNARALEQGYNTKAYHGTAGDISEFDLSHGGKVTKSRSAREAVWLSDDPVVAEGYARMAGEHGPVTRLIDESYAAERAGNHNLAESLMAKAEELEQSGRLTNAGGQNVIPSKIRGNLKRIDADGATLSDFDDGQLQQWIQEAKAEGFDGLQIDNFSDSANYDEYNPATHYAIFDPSNIRSVNAAFDPAKKDSANLLAGLGALGLGVGGAASMLTPQSANASDEPWYEKVLKK